MHCLTIQSCKKDPVSVEEESANEDLTHSQTRIVEPGIRTPALEQLNMNFVSGAAVTFTLDLMQYLLRKDDIH